MISRLAMRENTAVLVLVVALALLLWGLRESHELATFLGGIVAGLGFYVYYPARVAFPIWIVFLIAARARSTSSVPCAAAALARRDHDRRLRADGDADHLRRVADPSPQSTAARTTSLLIYNDGARRAAELGVRGQPVRRLVDEREVRARHVQQHVVDHGWIYANPGHGFVDPLTGILLWLGVGLVGARASSGGGARTRARCSCSAASSCSGSSFAFARQQGSELHAAADHASVRRVPRRRGRSLARRSLALVRFGPQLLVGAFVAALVVWNVSIAWDYIQLGRRGRRSDRRAPAATCARTRTCRGRSSSLLTSNVDALLRLGQRPPSRERISLFRPRSSRQVVDPHALAQFSAAPAVRAPHAQGGLAARLRPSSPTAIRAGGSATSRPTARGSCSKFRPSRG